MKSTVFTTAFALAIAAVSAVNISDVPTCALDCVNAGITATKCSESNATCICSNTSFASGLSTCIKTAPASCSEADQQKVMNLANEFCSSGSSSSAASTGTGSSTHKSTTTGSATQSAPTASSSSTFDISKIPACADSCAITALAGTKCDQSNYGCICKDQTFLESLEPCVQKACSAADQQTMLGIAEKLCSQYGVNLNSVISASATSMPTTTGANSTKTHSTNTTPTLYGNSTSSTTSGSSASGSGSSTESTTAPPTGTGTATATTSAKTTASTGGAVKIAGSGFVAAAIGAAFFLL